MVYDEDEDTQYERERDRVDEDIYQRVKQIKKDYQSHPFFKDSNNRLYIQVIDKLNDVFNSEEKEENDKEKTKVK